MDDKLYFSDDSLKMINTELLLRILAHQKLLVKMNLHPDKYKTEEDTESFLVGMRDKILKDLYEEHGLTPDTSIEPKP